MAKKKVTKAAYKNSYYSKRPMWQWVLLYIVIGGIVYFAIYYFLLAPQGGYNYQPSGNMMQQNNY